MRKTIPIPDHIGSRTAYKRKFSLREMYLAFVAVPQAAAKMIGNRIRKRVDNDLIERVQLEVTEVNGCAACSYAHAYLALKQGMSSEEIRSFLSGDGRFIKKEEARAIVFAQHFADARGCPKKEAYRSIVDEYGEERASIILSAAQLMLAGNIYGIPYSALRSRLKGKPYHDSAWTYEWGMQIAGLLLWPWTLIHGLVRALFGVPNIRLDERAAVE